MARAIRRRRLSMRLAGGLLLTHLGGRPERSAVPEEDLRARFRWTGRRFGAVLRALDRQGLVRRVDGAGGGLTLTEAGAALVSRAEREGLPVHALAGR
jgi:DNA-binding IscR family transcriptional regulator